MTLFWISIIPQAIMLWIYCILLWYKWAIPLVMLILVTDREIISSYAFHSTLFVTGISTAWSQPVLCLPLCIDKGKHTLRLVWANTCITASIPFHRFHVSCSTSSTEPIINIAMTIGLLEIRTTWTRLKCHNDEMQSFSLRNSEIVKSF